MVGAILPVPPLAAGNEGGDEEREDCPAKEKRGRGLGMTLPQLWPLIYAYESLHLCSSSTSSLLLRPSSSSSLRLLFFFFSVSFLLPTSLIPRTTATFSVVPGPRAGLHLPLFSVFLSTFTGRGNSCVQTFPIHWK